MAETKEQPKKLAFQGNPSEILNDINEDHETFQPESGRYHLYISYACPFAHRTLIARSLKGLQDAIDISVVHPTFQKTKPGVDDHLGWVFRKEGDEPLKNANGFGSIPCDGCIPDTVNNCQTVRDLYDLVGSFNKFSVPVLWDKKTKTMVSNDSAGIVRTLNASFNKIAKNPSVDLYPEALRSKIDEITKWVQAEICLGVYKAGFAQTQEVYDEGIKILFPALERVEEILSKSRYLVGNQLTEVDAKLFATLFRFDEVYHIYFKCNKKRIIDYPNLLNYARDIYQTPGIKETTNMEHVKKSYFSNHANLNYYAIVPVGPNFVSTLEEKHDRNRFN